MIAEIKPIRAPALRLHVVGDFYSAEYIRKWIRIMRDLPNVHFFGSTRSWRVPKLVAAIEELRDQPNAYIRASVDYTDNLAPGSKWSTWSVEGPGETCPHDRGKALSCYVCGRCWNDKQTNTKFDLRWGSTDEYLIRPVV